MSGLRLRLSRNWSVKRNGEVIYERGGGFSHSEDIGTMDYGQTWVLNYDLGLGEGMVIKEGDILTMQFKLTSSKPSE